MAQLSVPHIMKRGGGSIVFISSIGGFQPFAVCRKMTYFEHNAWIIEILKLLGPYSVSKTALLGLTKVMAQEVASDNIRVNCVAPGIVRTKFSEPVSYVH